MDNLLSSLAAAGDYKNRGDLDGDAGERRACRFDKELLGKCSGTTDKNFGFKDGKPCVIVKLNRIVNFRPKVSKQASSCWSFKVQSAILIQCTSCQIQLISLALCSLYTQSCLCKWETNIVAQAKP